MAADHGHEPGARSLPAPARHRHTRRIRFVPGDDPGPAQQAQDREQERAVRGAVLALPEHQRTVVTMYHLEGKPVEEIMRELGLPKGTVVSRLSRGREALRRQLAAYVEG